jgi:NADH-quinone oxidoreductase subunit H
MANPALTDSLIVCILRAVVFFAKTIVILFIFMWVRWSIPRFRFDQLLDIAWRALIPMSLALTVCTAILVWFTRGTTLDGVGLREALYFLAMNVIVLIATVAISRVLPAAPPTNRRLRVAGSRFSTSGTPTTTAATSTAVIA